MALEVRCPSCARRLRLPDDLAGVCVQCPGCRRAFTAAADAPRPPAPEGPPPEPAPRPGDAIRGEGEFPEPAPSRQGRSWEGGGLYDVRRVRTGDAASEVSAPATALVLAGSLALVVSVLPLLVELVSLAVGDAPEGPAPRGDGKRAADNFVVGVGVTLVGALWGGILLAGGLCMKRRRNYGLALAASVVALVPCNVCCVLGVPFGIWSIDVLRRQAVRDAFT